MYIYRKRRKSNIGCVEKLEGEPIEWKIERIVSNKEPIEDGAPEIFTERSEGVISAYNIRTDRWEVAAEAMDKVQASIQAKRENKGALPKKENKEAAKETKVVDINKNVGGAESIQGQEKAK
jgi:hypothetical protein